MFIGDNHENPAKNDQISDLVIASSWTTRIKSWSFPPVMYIGDNHENPAKNDQISRIVMPSSWTTRIQSWSFPCR